MNKKNLILAGVLVVLIAMAYVYNGPLEDWREEKEKPINFLSKLVVDGINKIEIKKGEAITILEKAGKRWKIGGTKEFYANENLTDTMINNLNDATKSDFELVSSNKAKKEYFQTNEEKGVKVRLLKENSEMAVFVVGKISNDYISTYISELNSDLTYLVKSDLTVFNQSDWHDKIIFSSDKNKIAKIRFQYPTREFTIEKGNINATSTEEAGWKGILPYVFSAGGDKVDAVLNIMSNLQAVKIPEQKFEGTGLDKHNIIVEATGDGINNTLMIGDENSDGLYYAKKGNSDNIYLISKQDKEILDVQIRDLK